MSWFSPANRFPLATAWVTTDDITGSGTTVGETTAISIPI